MGTEILKEEGKELESPEEKVEDLINKVEKMEFGELIQSSANEKIWIGKTKKGKIDLSFLEKPTKESKQLIIGLLSLQDIFNFLGLKEEEIKTLQKNNELISKINSLLNYQEWWEEGSERKKVPIRETLMIIYNPSEEIKKEAEAWGN